jgi:hypothetical protein
MISRLRGWSAAALALTLLLSACQEPPAAPETTSGPSFATDAWCAANPGKCGPTEPPEPSPSSPGYYTAFSDATCVSATGTGISDADHDGMSDYCEDFLAQRFRPELVVSPYDCDLGMEPYWAAKAFPNRGMVRIAYLFSYYRDCGPQQFKTSCLIGRIGSNILSLVGTLPPYTIPILNLPVSGEDPCEGHQGDSEFVTVDLRYDATTQHWMVSQAFFSAHWGTKEDHSRRVGYGLLEYPDRPQGYFRVNDAEGKHANYPTRAVCENDGGRADTCQSNYPLIRIRHAGQYNIGSARYNFISPKTCVRGGALVAAYPENYGTECYWDPQNTFQGWFKLPQPNDASPYYASLMLQFECFSYSRVVDSSGNTQVSCSYWGANP